MKIGKSIKIIILISGLVVYSGIYNRVMADENIPVSSQYTANTVDYAQRGLDYCKSGEYTKAVTDLTQAIKLNPEDTSSRINIAIAYISRGNQFSKIDLTRSANDYRRAVFYLKYDENLPQDQLSPDNLSAAVSNLKQTLIDAKISLTPNSRLKIARGLRGQGNFIEAVTEYNEALADNSLKFTALTELGDVMRVLQKNFRAIDYYQNALSIKPDNPDLHLKLARTLYSAEQTDNAIKEYNIALGLDENNKEIAAGLENIWKSRLQENPDDVDAHINLGVMLQKKGDFQGATAEYNAAQAIDPNNQILRLNLGTFFQAQGNIPMAIKAYDSILQVDPTNMLTHYYRATALKQSGDIKGAIEEFQIALKLKPDYIPAKKSLFETVKLIQNPDESLMMLDNISKTYPDDAVAQYNFAYALHLQNKTDDALAYYRKAVSIDPGLTDGYLNIATIYKEKNQYAEARAVLQNALSVNPDNKKIKESLAQMQEDTVIAGCKQADEKYRHGDYEGAIIDYKKIISETEPSADIYVGLGAACQSANKIPEAISYYNKALELDKTNSPAIYYLGTIYYAQKNYEKSLASYQRVLTLDPDNNDAKEAIKAVKLAMGEDILKNGLNEYNSKKYQKALEIFNHAIQINPNDGYAYYYRGMTYDAQKKYLLAINDYKKALTKSDDLNTACYSMALDYDMLKINSEAKKAYQKFVSMSKNRDDEYVKYAKQRLKKL